MTLKNQIVFTLNKFIVLTARPKKIKFQLLCQIEENDETTSFLFEQNLATSVENLPSIHDVVFVISSVDINMIGIKNKEREHNNNDLYRVWPSIYKISIEYVRIVERRSTILKQNVKKVRVNTNAKQSLTACKKQIISISSDNR